MLAAVAKEVVPQLVRGDEAVSWIVDDTGLPKKGRALGGRGASVLWADGQAGQLPGGGERCRWPRAAAVCRLAFVCICHASGADDAARLRKVGVPSEVGFATKPQLALRQIAAALQAGYPRGTVLADAAYGDETAWREQLAEWGLKYAVGVRPATTVWWGEHQPAPEPIRARGAGRPRSRLRRDAQHQPIAVADLARALPARSWRTVTWRQGVAEPLRSRFARVRVRAAHRDRPRAEEWLIIEWARDADEPAHYWFSNLPEDMRWQPMVDTVMSRWRIERDYLELKQELGLGHFEGRNWRGFHHHASLCVAAYGFLMLERLSGAKKNSARFKTPALSAAFRPRGAGADAASHTLVDRDVPLSPRARRRQNPAAMPVLRTWGKSQ